MRRGELGEGVRERLDDEDVFVLMRCLRMIEHLDEEITELDMRIAMFLGGWQKDAKRISGVLGIAQVSASAILAGIGDAKRFENGRKIASWVGLCSGVYQTANRILRAGLSRVRRLSVELDCKWLTRLCE
ncbi:MAG: transposase [Candidatus Bathyarchaeia archaeon]